VRKERFPPPGWERGLLCQREKKNAVSSKERLLRIVQDHKRPSDGGKFSLSISRKGSSLKGFLKSRSSSKGGKGASPSLRQDREGGQSAKKGYFFAFKREGRELLARCGRKAVEERERRVCCDAVIGGETKIFDQKQPSPGTHGKVRRVLGEGNTGGHGNFRRGKCLYQAGVRKKGGTTSSGGEQEKKGDNSACVGGGVKSSSF